MTIPSDIPLPAEPRHQRYADLRLRGLTRKDAYLQAGFRCSPSSANSAGSRLDRRPDIQAYLQAVKAAATGTTILDLLEIRRFLARTVRVPITKLAIHQDQDADLIKSYSTQESEDRSSFRIEKHDPLKAIEIDLKLSGNDPDTNALKQFSEALLTLGGHNPIPNDTL
jgi:phage terminase small subunit